MKKLHEAGSLLVPFVLVLLLFLGAAGFGAWAYLTRQDYKDNSDQKVAAAVDVAKKETEVTKDKEFVEKEKQPYETYKGPVTYGTVTVMYPKVWSAYASESANSTPVDAYFHPGHVPGVGLDSVYALRVQIVNSSYDRELLNFSSYVKQGKAKVSPYRLPQVQGILGSRVDGTLYDKKTGSMILLPLRDKTLKISTESTQFVKDFDTHILPNLTFVP